MELTVTGNGGRLVEGVAGQPLMRSVDDVAAVIEACFSNEAERVLLYSENLTEGFFDLSSREAGAILQRLRNYRIRMAVVCSPGVRLSHRFGELMAEENRGPWFRLFDTREAACKWLCSDAAPATPGDP